LTDASFILAPHLVTVRFDLAPALNAIDSMVNLIRVGLYSGLPEWPVSMAARLTPEERLESAVIFEGFGGICYKVDDEMAAAHWNSLEGYVEYLSNQDPYQLRDLAVEKMLTPMSPGSQPPSREALLADREVFFNWLTTMWPEEKHDRAVYDEVHALLNDPPAMLRRIVAHLRNMWDKYVRAEWERVLPMLKDAIGAFQRLDFSHATVSEAIRRVTGREVPAPWEEKLSQVEHITFIPSAHIGPYLVGLIGKTHARIIFGARLPREAGVSSPALSRSELLVRLNALADDSRLRILELLTQEEELCAQDIIGRLELSQSSVSRHLSQLAATGYVTERRRDVAKCYSLNRERIDDTVNALNAFLKKR
jgi:ArsR family transcriptional regulator